MIRQFVVDCVDDDVAAILRDKTEWERLEIAFGLWRFARAMVENNIQTEHPEWSAEEVQRQVARRMSHGTV